MLEIESPAPGRIRLRGWFDAVQAPKAEEAFQALAMTYVVDLKDLEYISSAGLGVLLSAQRRLEATGHGLVLTRPSPHLENVLVCAGLDRIFVIR